MIRNRTSQLIVFIMIAALLLGACSGTDKPSKSSTSKKASSASDGCTLTDKPQQWDTAPASNISPSEKVEATLTTTQGDITIKLLPADAPNAVSNFVFLAEEGFYTCVPFHRIIANFMVQTGDPTGTGTGGPGYTITDDKVSKPYSRGTVAMANTGAPDSGGSQFFIVHGTTVNDTLTPTYARFGEVTKGLDVLDAIAETPVEAGDSGEVSSPTEDVWLEKVTITRG